LGYADRHVRRCWLVTPLGWHHFETGDLHGRGLGKMIGINAWNKAQTYVDGTATTTT
jgi:hypothetical protein